MKIEFTIKYTDLEYLWAVKEKMTQMPNKLAHTYLPILGISLLMFTLTYYQVTWSWWLMLLSGLAVIYALICLFANKVLPSIALWIAKKTKLKETYSFTIDSKQVVRKSNNTELRILWSEFSSVDIFNRTIFLNNKDGAVVIPKARLSSQQLKTLTKFVKEMHRNTN